MNTMNFLDDIRSILIGKFEDMYILLSDQTSMQNATENCHELEPV